MNRRALAFALVLCLPLPLAAADPSAPEPIAPRDGVVKLFNGKDLSGLYTWLKDSEYEDPRQVFTVEDGMLHISGDGLGGIITRDSYRDYHLVFEFKWGERTWHNRKDRTKDSGILIHCHGPDGAYGGIWPASLESQVIDGGCGDFIVVAPRGTGDEKTPLSITCEVTTDRDGEYVWHAGGERKTFESGRVNWFGRDPDWKDVLGFRGSRDVESPDGEWTRMDVVCKGGQVTNYVNGVKVNEGFDATPSAGKILIQTELAALWVRRWELWPLAQAPKPAPAEQNPKFAD